MELYYSFDGDEVAIEVDDQEIVEVVTDAILGELKDKIHRKAFIGLYNAAFDYEGRGLDYEHVVSEWAQDKEMMTYINDMFEGKAEEAYLKFSEKRESQMDYPFEPEPEGLEEWLEERAYQRMIEDDAD